MRKALPLPFAPRGRPAAPPAARASSLRTRLLLGNLLLVLLPILLVALAVGALSLQSLRQSLLQAQQEKLVVIRDAAKRQIQENLQRTLFSSAVAARNPSLVAALQAFSQGWARLPQDGQRGQPPSPAFLTEQRTALRSYYQDQWLQTYLNLNAGQSLDLTPYLASLDSRSLLLQAALLNNQPGLLQGSAYGEAYTRYHPLLQELLQGLELNNLYLVDAQGVVVYSNRIDLGRSLLKAPLENSPMARVFREARQNLDRRAVLSDLSFYTPAFDELLLFSAAPVYQGQKLLGVVVLEAPVGRFDNILTNYANYEELGLGQRGDVYLLNLNNGLFLSNQRAFLRETDAYLESLRQAGLPPSLLERMLSKGSVAGLLKTDPEVVQRANLGAGAGQVQDLLMAYDQVRIADLPWALAAQIPLEEALAPLGPLQQRFLLVLGAVLLLVVGLALLATQGFVNTITRPIQAIAKVVEAFGQGNLSQRVNLQSNDEIGQLGQAFNQAMAQLEAFFAQQAEEQRRSQQLQQNVSAFLQIATEIAQGDLTKRGQVTEDVLGNVVDAVNLAIEELAQLLKEVQKAAQMVNHSAIQMDQLTASIAIGAAAQAQEVGQVQAQTQQVTQNIRQMAQSANQTAQAALQTLESAQLGRQAVAQVLSGMQSIRQEMQGIAQNIAALSQRSAEIEEIAKVLEEFASQTNLLALNASFEAAGAGAAGRRFAIVADEIRKLAEESARETSRVGSLIQQVQKEIAQVVGLVQEGVREVETGYGVAQTAGSRLEEIARLAEASAGLAQAISSLAQGQVALVERVEEAVQNIAQTAQQTGQESQEGRRSAEAMRLLAEQLSRGLARFRLPN